MADEKETDKGTAAKEQTPEQLAKQLAKSEKQNERLTKLLAEANDRNNVLAKTKGNKHPVVEVDGDHYQINHAARKRTDKGGQVLMPEQIAQDPAFLQHLIKTRSTVLTKVAG